MKFVLFVILFFSYACNNCGLVECQGSSELINIRVIKNGQNAVFGPAALIDRDSISFSVLGIEEYVGFNEIKETIVLGLQTGFSYLLKFNDGDTDTLMIHMILTGRSECCESYELTDVIINGQVVCQDSCETKIIDLEI